MVPPFPARALLMATSHDDDGDDDNLSIPNLPEHWDFGGEIHPILGPRNPILFIHRLLCIISFGCANLQTVWAKTHTSAWRSTREDMKDRMQHTSIMARYLDRASFTSIDSLISCRLACCSRRSPRSAPRNLQRVRGYSHTPRQFHTVSS